MLPNKSGFTLLELMIVISIISILTAIAIPSYQRYLQRARFVEIINIAEAFKTAVSIALQEGAEPSTINNGTNGIPEEPSPTKNLSNLKVVAGVITAVGTALVNNATYILTPNLDGTQWLISGTCIESGLCHAA